MCDREKERAHDGCGRESRRDREIGIGPKLDHARIVVLGDSEALAERGGEPPGELGRVHKGDRQTHPDQEPAQRGSHARVGFHPRAERQEQHRRVHPTLRGVCLDHQEAEARKVEREAGGFEPVLVREKSQVEPDADGEDRRDDGRVVKRLVVACVGELEPGFQPGLVAPQTESQQPELIGPHHRRRDQPSLRPILQPAVIERARAGSHGRIEPAPGRQTLDHHDERNGHQSHRYRRPVGDRHCENGHDERRSEQGSAIQPFPVAPLVPTCITPNRQAHCRNHQSQCRRNESGHMQRIRRSGSETEHNDVNRQHGRADRLIGQGRPSMCCGHEDQRQGIDDEGQGAPQIRVRGQCRTDEGREGHEPGECPGGPEAGAQVEVEPAADRFGRADPPQGTRQQCRDDRQDAQAKTLVRPANDPGRLAPDRDDTQEEPEVDNLCPSPASSGTDCRERARGEGEDDGRPIPEAHCGQPGRDEDGR